MDRGLQNGLPVHHRDTDLLLTTGLSHTKNCQRCFGTRLTKALPQLWGLFGGNSRRKSSKKDFSIRGGYSTEDKDIPKKLTHFSVSGGCKRNKEQEVKKYVEKD